MQTRRLAASFKVLNCSLPWSPGELWSCKVAWKQQLMQVLKVQIYRITAANVLTLWCLAEIGDFRKKTPKRTWLCTGIYPLLYGLRTWSKHQKMRQVF